ncbi:hypothetical protein TcCL_NonESM00531 [Trypanosoma cruzi]|nr:hypothetical protein TcCL_NonESM00531 [Trypanosoma cruzi]
MDLLELTRPHTGHECCPEVPRTAARVLAEDPEIARPQSVAPRVVRRLLFGLAVSEPAGCGGVWFSGALSKWCESIGLSFSYATKSVGLFFFLIIIIIMIIVILKFSIICVIARKVATILQTTHFKVFFVIHCKPKQKEIIIAPITPILSGIEEKRL